MSQMLEPFESETGRSGSYPQRPHKSHLGYRIIKVLSIVGAAFALALWPWPVLNEAQRIMLGIFAAAAGLWMTEAIPPFATAILVIVCSAYFLGAPGGPMGFSGATDYLIFVQPVADPVIVLFFGGFILAIAATKFGLDRLMAALILHPFCRSGSSLVLGVILVTGFTSMFMSNTATALMMMAILAPLIHGLSDSRLAKALVLAVAFAANVGGVGTIIGTPPNALAVKALLDAGIRVTFLQWMLFGVPFALTMMLVLWLILINILRPGNSAVFLETTNLPKWNRNLMLVAAVFLVTVLLWVTEAFHGVRPELVAMLPLAVFTSTGLIGTADLKRVEWDVLILVAGGLALGVGLSETGLSQIFVGALPVGELPTLGLVLALGLVTVVLSNFMSNTSAANIIVPIAVALSSGSPMIFAVVVAISASLAMSLPISTPPNAVVYGTGVLNSSDLMRIGSLITLCGIVILMLAISLWQAILTQ